MLALKLSRLQVARRLGLSRASVTMYILCRTVLRRVVALAFQACYGVRADWILLGEEPVFVEIKKATRNLGKRGCESVFVYEIPAEFEDMSSSIVTALRSHSNLIIETLEQYAQRKEK